MIKYLHAAEYGGKLGRPHYHVIMFGADFYDRYHWRTTSAGHKVYRSLLLERSWSDIHGSPIGNCEIGSVTVASARYVSAYILNKKYGDDSLEHYMFYDGETGEYVPRKPEYCTMSRGGRTGKGLGYAWLKKNYKEVYSEHFADYIYVDGARCKVPRYYDRIMQEIDPDIYYAVKERRLENVLKRQAEYTPERLKERERFLLAKQRNGKRKLK